MKRSAFHRWMGRIGLMAALLLVVVPTAGRIVHAVDPLHAATAGSYQPDGPHGGGGAHHGRWVDVRSGHAADAHHDERGGRDARPAIGDPDCDYCPLLSSMTEAVALGFALAQGPMVDRPSTAATTPALRWRHPWGLGSRGPP